MLRKRVIAVDFDGTLCTHKFPEIGEIKQVHQNVINYVKQCRANGNIIVLWTCREDLPDRAYLTEAVEWCKEQGIEFDSVNEYVNPEVSCFGKYARKIAADEYIDDKAVNIKEFEKVT